MKKVFVCLFLFIFLTSVASAALGITPAKIEKNFVPNDVIEIDYTIISDDPNKEILLYLGGGLADYATLDRDTVLGGGSVKVILTLPENLENPGKNTLTFVAEEVPPEDKFIATAITIGVIVNIYAPFPGRYVQASLNVEDGNVGDEIKVEAYVDNQGLEDLENVDVEVNFRDDLGELVGAMDFTSVSLVSGEDRYFRKILNTQGFRPGSYVAEAVISYGEISVVKDDFRIGSLFVNITDFTDVLESGGIKEFVIDIESFWNNKLDNVFADVNVSNSVENIIFRTPSIDLNPWQKSQVKGFIDTDGMEGVYDVEVVLSYSGETTTKNGTLRIKEVNYMLLIGLAAIVFAAVLVLLIILHLKKKRKKRK